MNQVQALEEAAGFLSDAKYNISKNWTGGAADRVVTHIDAAAILLEIEIKRIE